MALSASDKAMVQELVDAVAEGNGLSKAAKNKKTVVAEVERFGEKLIVPKGMQLEDAAKLIKDKMVEEETVITLTETFDVFVWEGAYALVKTLDDLYGWAKQLATPGFFWDIPPQLRSVKIGPDSTVQVPWGRFQLANIPAKDGYIETSVHLEEGEIPKFQLNAALKKKHSEQFHNLCAAVRKQLKTFSLYKGKTITVKFYDDNGVRKDFPEPDFIKINSVNKEELIFSRHLEAAIQANLYTPIERTQECREFGIPLKRGVGLAGPFGTGKTLVAQCTASLAQKNGWTYIVCPSVNDFADTVRFAHRYQPAVVFCEDIDKAVSGERNVSVDNVLNIIDGVNSKQTEIVLVLTTNEIENIHPAMIRPGRLDAILNITPPDGEAVGRLLRLYAGNLLGSDESLDKIGSKLAGKTPAVIREIVERSKLAAISLKAPDDPLVLSEEAFIIAADTMKMHLDLLDGKREEKPTPMEVFGKVMGNALVNGVNTVVRNNRLLADKALESVPDSFDEVGIVRVLEATSVTK